MKINKKFLQFIAGFLILVFHLWIPVSKTLAEQFIIKTAYIGVDIFFFLSAYSLAGREIEYKSFLKNRWLFLYGQFVIFVLANGLVNKSFGWTRIWQSLTFVELFKRGGGAFLWFVPAILILYLLYPLFLKWDFRWKVPVVLACWIALELVLERGLSYTSIFIFTNRIPVILAGYVLSRREIPKWTSVVMLPVGIALMYFWGFNAKLDVPVRDMFYILTIPVVISLAIASRYVAGGKVFNLLGGITLELYALQMILGAKLTTFIYRNLHSAIWCNITVLVLMYGLAFALGKLFALARGRISGGRGHSV